jgi:hypothetical protein
MKAVTRSVIGQNIKKIRRLPWVAKAVCRRVEDEMQYVIDTKPNTLKRMVTSQYTFENGRWTIKMLDVPYRVYMPPVRLYMRWQDEVRDYDGFLDEPEGWRLSVAPLIIPPNLQERGGRLKAIPTQTSSVPLLHLLDDRETWKIYSICITNQWSEDYAGCQTIVDAVKMTALYLQMATCDGDDDDYLSGEWAAMNFIDQPITAPV